MANGKIKADTLEHSTAGTVDTQFVVRGSAKVWLKFGTSSSTASQGSPLNVSGLTDNGTGDTSVAFVSAFNDAHYSTTFGYGINMGSDQKNQFDQELEAQATGSCKIYNHSGGTLTDANFIFTTLHGDLA